LVRNSRRVTELNVGDDALHLFGQDTHDFSLNSFTHAYPDVTNGRFEAASESKGKECCEHGPRAKRGLGLR